MDAQVLLWGNLLLFVVAFAVNIIGRREREKLRGTLAQKEAQIEKLNADMLAVLDERNRYKGAWEACAPKPGEIHVTRIVRYDLTVEEQIDEMIREVEDGSC